MKIFEQSSQEGASEVKKNFKKTLILVFEVIVQPPKTHFLTFSSETKIIKITHSELLVGLLVILGAQILPFFSKVYNTGTAHRMKYACNFF